MFGSLTRDDTIFYDSNLLWYSFYYTRWQGNCPKLIKTICWVLIRDHFGIMMEAAGERARRFPFPVQSAAFQSPLAVSPLRLCLYEPNQSNERSWENLWPPKVVAVLWSVYFTTGAVLTLPGHNRTVASVLQWDLWAFILHTGRDPFLQCVEKLGKFSWGKNRLSYMSYTYLQVPLCLLASAYPETNFYHLIMLLEIRVNGTQQDCPSFKLKCFPSFLTSVSPKL